MLLGDFHTHSTLDDGKSTLAQMAAAAYDLGLTYFGFSGHSFEEYAQDFCLSRANVPVYLETARKLQEEYRGQMEIFVGLELDYFGEKPEGLDYVIGSVHGLRLGEGQVCLCGCQCPRIVRGRWMNTSRRLGTATPDAYYDLVADLPRKDRVPVDRPL